MSSQDQIPDLQRFALDNGWGYAAKAEPPALSENLWERVSYGIVRDRVQGQGWEAGRLTGGSRSAQQTEQRGRWTVTKRVTVNTPVSSIDLGYLAITLPRRLPHMVLDARSNDRGPFSSLVNRPKGSQALMLEGQFEKSFRLYVPKGYERDAFYVFSPDLMALLIDETGDLDVEIRDDRLIVYKPGGFDLHAAETWRRFERIRDTLGEKTWKQTDMYQDERAESQVLQLSGAAKNEIHADGRRLRKRLPAIVWLGGGIAVVALVFAAIIVTIVLTQVLP